jgi:PBP1b-binding outer membrane lipoprotein LpoB
MARFIPITAALLALAGCVQTPASSGQQTLANLTTIANTAQADLTTAIAVANAATPPDTAGANCAKAAMQVATDIKKVMAATPAGSTVGVFTAAEIASLYAPGSAQFNNEVSVIATGCIAKLNAVMAAGQSPIGFPAAIAAALSIAATPVGL